MKIIPDIDRSEWRELLTGSLVVTLNSYLMKMMLSQAKEQLQEKSISLDDAVMHFHAKCVRFSKTEGVLDDIGLIFKKKEEQDKTVLKTVEKEAKKGDLNFEIEHFLTPDTQIKKEETPLESEVRKSEITTSIEETKKLKVGQENTKLQLTGFKNEASRFVDKTINKEESTIEKAKLKTAKERSAFEESLKQEQIANTVVDEKKKSVDNKLLVKEQLVVKTKSKRKTNSILRVSSLDTTRKNTPKKSLLEKLSTIFLAEE